MNFPPTSTIKPALFSSRGGEGIKIVIKIKLIMGMPSKGISFAQH